MVIMPRPASMANTSGLYLGGTHARARIEAKQHSNRQYLRRL